MVEGDAVGLVSCLCKFCSQSEVKPAAECIVEKRVKHHMNNVGLLVQNSPTVKLLVGPEKAEYHCHKLLLSYYSSSFDKEIFGSSNGRIAEVMTFPECSAREMGAFVSWLYLGRLDRKLNQRFPCSLYKFAMRFGAPSFANDAMLLLCDNIRCTLLRVSTANFIYKNSEAKSPLHLFITENFTHVNPLSPSLAEMWTDERRKIYRTGWINLIAEGGEFMRDIAECGLHNDNEQQAPWRPSKFCKFLENEPDRSPTSWKIGRTSETPERSGAAGKQQHTEEQRGLKRTISSTAFGTDEHVGTKKQKESNEQTPTRPKDSNNKTPTSLNNQTPTRQNSRTPNGEKWKITVSQRDQPSMEQNDRIPVSQYPPTPTRPSQQTAIGKNHQTPTRQIQTPHQVSQYRETYVPPFQHTFTAPNAMDTGSCTDDDAPIRERLARSS